MRETKSNDRKNTQNEPCMQEHLFDHFKNECHSGFLGNVSKTIIDKTNGGDPKMKENKKYNCSGPPVIKNQRVGYQSNQKLLHHYQHSKINSIHKFILKIQQILGSHELKGHGHFSPRPSKNL